jgi:hypothetical protein
MQIGRDTAVLGEAPVDNEIMRRKEYLETAGYT